MSVTDWLAVAVISFLVWWPLFMAPVPDPQSVAEITQSAEYQNHWQRIIAGTHITDWILALVGVGQLVILGVQAGIYDRQRTLMERQTQATENQTALMGDQLTAAIASANAAKEAADAATRASYADRAWLFIEDAKRTRIDRTPDEKGIFRFNVSFSIRNAGRTPAVLTEITFRVFCAINLFRQPDPNNLGIDGIEVDFGNWLTENSYKKRYPMRDQFGVRGASQITIGANSATGTIESSGHFEDRIIAPVKGFDKMDPWETVYCLIQMKYLDFYRMPRETSFYAIISHKAEAERPRDSDLDTTYNYWN